MKETRNWVGMEHRVSTSPNLLEGLYVAQREFSWVARYGPDLS